MNNDYASVREKMKSRLKKIRRMGKETHEQMIVRIRPRLKPATLKSFDTFLVGDKTLGVFLGLPLVLRRRVYRLLVPNKRIIDTSHPIFRGCPFRERANYDFACNDEWVYGSLQLPYTVNEREKAVALELDDDWEPGVYPLKIYHLSKQTSEEALDILYGENVVLVHLDLKMKRGANESEADFKERCEKSMIPDRHLPKIKHMVVVVATAPGMKTSEAPRSWPAPAQWLSILPNLRALRIVWKPVYEGDKIAPGWVDSIIPFLELCVKSLHTEAIVRVDVDRHPQAGQIFEQYFPDRYRQVECHVAGNGTFGRGQFGPTIGIDSLERSSWRNEMQWQANMAKNAARAKRQCFPRNQRPEIHDSEAGEWQFAWLRTKWEDRMNVRKWACGE